MARTLGEIREDLVMCAEYENQRTLQAAFKELRDIRLDLIELVDYLRKEAHDGPSVSGG